MRRKRIRKTAKKNTLSYWKKRLWTEFSIYIRTRDDFTCFTCGKVGAGSGIHAGHMIPKKIGGLSLYFCEQNVNAQCYYCNINLGGNGAIYAAKFIDVYGQEEFDMIMYLKDQRNKKYTIDEYKGLIQVYKDKTKELNDRQS